jgi:hypothetical protein
MPPLTGDGTSGEERFRGGVFAVRPGVGDEEEDLLESEDEEGSAPDPVEEEEDAPEQAEEEEEIEEDAVGGDRRLLSQLRGQRASVVLGGALSSDERQMEVSALREAVAGSRLSERLYALGLEVMVLEATEVPMPRFADIAALAHVAHARVGNYLDRLYKACPEIFPILDDVRGIELEEQPFATQAEWVNGVAELRTRFPKATQFRLARELLAAHLGQWLARSNTQIARHARIDRRTVDRRLESVTAAIRDLVGGDDAAPSD